MPDKTCDVCGVPKPEICFEHGEARAKRPSRVDTCQSCLRDLRRNARARRLVKAEAKAKKLRRHIATLRGIVKRNESRTEVPK